VWIHIWVFYSVPLVFMSVFVPLPCCFYCYCFVIQFEVWYCDTSSIAPFAEYCLGYSQSLVFPNELQGRFLNLCDECHWDFDGDCIKHVDCFGSIAIFTMCFYQSMSTGDLSTFCSLPQSLSSGAFSSPCRGHSHPLLRLLLGI
jgi:hypothetical protein